MYELTRQEVADKLNISTRSVDRYIKGGKLRAKKEGKVVYVSKDDVDNLLNGGESKQEVIINNKKSNTESKKSVIKHGEDSGTISKIYEDLKEEIVKKDHLIQTLAIRVGKAEEMAKNSISLVDFKKSQYLLEESKDNLNSSINQLERKNEKLESEIKYEKNSNIILIVFIVLLLIISGTIWFLNI